MFQIHLENIYRAEVGATEKLKLSGQASLPDDLSKAPADLESEAKLTRTNEGVILEFEAKSAFSTNCDRCLESFDFKTDYQFDHFLDNNHILHLKDYTFDAEPLLIENTVLSVPIKKLCQADCKGLCQSCGANLNKKSCNCKIEISNNPFKVLRQGSNGTTQEKDLKN
jgi:uncharacterized protein